MLSLRPVTGLEGLPVLGSHCWSLPPLGGLGSCKKAFKVRLHSLGFLKIRATLFAMSCFSKVISAPTGGLLIEMRHVYAPLHSSIWDNVQLTTVLTSRTVKAWREIASKND